MLVSTHAASNWEGKKGGRGDAVGTVTVHTSSYSLVQTSYAIIQGTLYSAVMRSKYVTE